MRAFRWIVGVVTCCAVVLPARAAEISAAGFWQGTLNVNGRPPLVLVLKITAEAQGGLQGKLDIPAKWLADLPLEGVTQENDKLHFELRIDRATFAGHLLSGGRIEGVWQQAGLTLPLAFDRLDHAPEMPVRRQTPRPPFPYQIEDIVLDRPAGVRLAGTLTLPPGVGPFPAAVLLTVAGPNDRDQTHSGHKPFLVLADALTRRGFAVLRLDDRGVGGSSGDLNQSTYADLADDAFAAVTFLRGRPGIDPRRIGLIGNSEGASIASLVASQHPETAFIVLLGGPGLPTPELLAAQAETLARRQGYTDEEIRQGLARMDRLFRILLEEQDDAKAAERLRELQKEPATGRPLPLAAALAAPGDPEAWLRLYLSPWYRSQLRYDPRTTLTRVSCPVLAITGSLDPVTDPKRNLPPILSALVQGQSRDITILQMPGLNHLFQTSQTGLPAEYAQIEETFAPAALDRIGDWLAERFLKQK